MKSSFYISFNMFMIIVMVYLTKVKSDTDRPIYADSTTINPNINIVKTFALSPFKNQIIIAGIDGTLNLFNYQSGNFIKRIQSLTPQTQILKILWQNNKYGLIIIYNDKIAKHSFVIQRDKDTLRELYRLQFNELIYAADSTSDMYDSYFALAFANRTDEYEMRNRVITQSYLAYSRNLAYTNILYASDYKVIFLSGNSNYTQIMHCGSYYAYLLGNNQNVSYKITADKYDHIRAPLIVKYSIEGFRILDENYSSTYQATFPATQIDYFKYCPTDFIIGVTPESSIKIYTRDYKFTELDSIQKFTNLNLTIKLLECNKGYIFVSTDDNKIYTFKLFPDQTPRQDPKNWVLVFILIGVGIIVIGIITIIIFKKFQNRKLSKQESLVTGPNHSQIIYNQ